MVEVREIEEIVATIWLPDNMKFKD